MSKPGRPPNMELRQGITALLDMGVKPREISRRLGCSHRTVYFVRSGSTNWRQPRSCEDCGVAISAAAAKCEHCRDLAHTMAPEDHRNEEGHLFCSGCRRWMPEERFYRSTSVTRGFKNDCKDCHRIWKNAYRARLRAARR